MSTAPQILANRANAQSSTGPTSPEGKAVVSQNAFRHGLAVRTLVILEDEIPEFNLLAAELREEISPVGFLEETAFERLLTARWNMFRVQKVEARLAFLSEGQDPLEHPETEAKVQLYWRYYQRFDASYRSALRELERLQTYRAADQELSGEYVNEPLPKLTNVMSLQRVVKQSQTLDPTPREMVSMSRGTGPRRPSRPRPSLVMPPDSPSDR